MLADYITSTEARVVQEIALLMQRLASAQHAAATKLSQMQAQEELMHSQGRNEEAAAWEQAQRVVHMQVQILIPVVFSFHK